MDENLLKVNSDGNVNIDDWAAYHNITKTQANRILNRCKASCTKFGQNILASQRELEKVYTAELNTQEKKRKTQLAKIEHIQELRKATNLFEKTLLDSNGVHKISKEDYSSFINDLLNLPDFIFLISNLKIVINKKKDLKVE